MRISAYQCRCRSVNEFYPHAIPRKALTRSPGADSGWQPRKVALKRLDSMRHLSRICLNILSLTKLNRPDHVRSFPALPVVILHHDIPQHVLGVLSQRLFNALAEVVQREQY